MCMVGSVGDARAYMSQQHETVSQMRRLVNLTSEGGRYQIGARVIGAAGDTD